MENDINKMWSTKTEKEKEKEIKSNKGNQIFYLKCININIYSFRNFHKHICIFFLFSIEYLFKIYKKIYKVSGRCSKIHYEHVIDFYKWLLILKSTFGNTSYLGIKIKSSLPTKAPKIKFWKTSNYVFIGNINFLNKFDEKCFS